METSVTYSHTVSTSLETGVITREKYQINNVGRHSEGRHNMNGPAYIERDENTGVTTLEIFYERDEKHRVNAPAVIKRDENTGEIIETEYWEDGEQVSPPPTSYTEKIKQEKEKESTKNKER
jgi:uncharacterized protein YuzE